MTAVIVKETFPSYQPTTVALLGSTALNIVWISRDGGMTWTKDIPLDTSSYGYPGSYILDKDESILVPYCSSGRTPNRVYLVRIRVNKSRDGLELLPLVR